MPQAVFIYADGILHNYSNSNESKLESFKDFQINNDALESMRILRSSGFMLVALEQFPNSTDNKPSRADIVRMKNSLKENFLIDNFLPCFHERSDCQCLSPGIDLLKQAGANWNISLERSFLLSRRPEDMQSAKTAGCTAVLLGKTTPHWCRLDILVPDLETAVAKIVEYKNLHGPALGKSPVAHIRKR
ncbi:MAG TPA: hypothetical protein VJI66_01320 [Candidatus Paceibacterota bacterium]